MICEIKKIRLCCTDTLIHFFYFFKVPSMYRNVNYLYQFPRDLLFPGKTNSQGTFNSQGNCNPAVARQILQTWSILFKFSTHCSWNRGKSRKIPFLKSFFEGVILNLFSNGIYQKSRHSFWLLRKKKFFTISSF